MPFPIPFLIHVGSFQTPTGTGFDAVSGVGFKPTAVILFYGGTSENNAWQGTGSLAQKTGLAMSFFVAPTTAKKDGRGAAQFESSEDNSSALFATMHGLHQEPFRIEDSDGTILVSTRSDYSMDEDGFTLDYDAVPPDRYVVGYIALGGGALSASIVKWTMPSQPGVQEKAVTGVGFSPDLVLHMFANDFIAAPWPDETFSSDGYAAFHVGAMDKFGNQWALGTGHLNAVPTATNRSFRDDRVMFNDPPAAGFGDVEAEYVSMDPDGFTLRFIQAGIGPGHVASLALGGIRAKAGTFARGVSNGIASVAGVGFQPKGLILATGQHDDFGTFTDVAAGLGAASGQGEEFAVSRIDNDGQNPSVSLKRSEEAVYVGRDTEVVSGVFESFDADGFSIDWATDSANAHRVGYIALGSPPLLTPHLFEAELNGVDGGWTDLSGDVLLESPSVNIHYGSGTGPLDLTAHTGTMRFGLDNSEHNSAGLVGYYSPHHANCRPGFDRGVRVRYSYLTPDLDGYGKFIGRLKEIDPIPGRYRDRKTICLAVDWMNEAATTRYNAPTQLGQRTDQILSTVLALVPRQPDSTSFDVADSTFAYALDTGLVEKSTVMTECQRLMQSEYGRCYIKGGFNEWGIFRFEKRTARIVPFPLATFDGTMQDLQAARGTDKIKNRSKVIVHPRRVDVSATTVLFAKPDQDNPSVPPLGVLTLSGRYVDPANPNARVGGMDMVAPVATTDYLMNANADGSGADRTANFTAVAVYGANQVDYTITNTHATLAAFVTKLQARGRGLYDYDPLESDIANQESIDAFGESLVTLDMPYQSSVTVAGSIAQFLVDTWSSHETSGAMEAAIKYIPRTDAATIAAMALEVGDPIRVMEEMTVINDVYFIQAVDIVIGYPTRFTWDLQRALVQAFWKLGVAGFSELGETTVPAPL